MRKAVKLWETAEYWTARAEGAIRHAKYKEKPAVRARRIKTIEADKRKQERSKAGLERCLKLWTREGLTLEQARLIAGRTEAGHLTVCHTEGRAYGWSAYNVLQPDGERYQDCPSCTVEQVQAKARQVYPSAIARCERWIAHCENRLAYERAILAESGGIATDKVKPEKGGACRCWASPRGGWSLIQKVNKVSVTVLDNWGNGGRDFKRTIPFDKLQAVMSKAEVDAARVAGRLIGETSIGFGLLAEASKAQETGAGGTDKTADRVDEGAFGSNGSAPPPGSGPENTFDAMRQALKAGVQVVSAPQFFPTPADLARRVIELADIQPGQTVLEPSAGTGSLLQAIREACHEVQVSAVEINHTLADGIRCHVAEVRCADFLALNGELGQFDRIVMNPPFANAQDIRHIEHALTKLKAGGRLVAICANGPRQQAKLQPIADQWIDLPTGSFQEAGTNVNAAIVVIDR